jgi:mannose-6-phosphate isomerase
LGTRQGVAINAILDDGRIHNASARLWPQTERIKALLGAYRSTGDGDFLHAAVRAGLSLLPYLDTGIAGLWHDELLPSGEFTSVPVSTSTFYHLVGVVVLMEEIGRNIELSEPAQGLWPHPCP